MTLWVHQRYRKVTRGTAGLNNLPQTASCPHRAVINVGESRVFTALHNGVTFGTCSIPLAIQWENAIAAQIQRPLWKPGAVVVLCHSKQE